MTRNGELTLEASHRMLAMDGNWHLCYSKRISKKAVNFISSAFTGLLSEIYQWKGSYSHGEEMMKRLHSMEELVHGEPILNFQESFAIILSSFEDSSHCFLIFLLQYRIYTCFFCHFFSDLCLSCVLLPEMSLFAPLSLKISLTIPSPFHSADHNMTIRD